MDVIVRAITISFDYLLKPFSPFPPYVGLCFISAITGIILLKLFGIFSNQVKIRESKDQIKAHLLGIVLYKDDIRTSLKIQVKMLGANFRYLRCSLLPLIILVLLCIPILGQLNIRYGYRAFAVGEKIKLFVHLDNGSPLNDVSLETGEALKILTPPLRIKETGEVDWKLEAVKPGQHMVEISTSGRKYTKEIVVGSTIQKIIPNRSKSLIYGLLYPGDKLLPKKSQLNSIKVEYPSGYVSVFGHDLHWLLVFCVVSILSGLSFKRLLKVEI